MAKSKTLEIFVPVRFYHKLSKLLHVFYSKFLIFFHFTRYYHAIVDEMRKKIKELIKEGNWNSDELSRLKHKLLKKLNIHEQDMLEQDILLKQKLDNLKDELQKSIKQKLEDIQSNLDDYVIFIFKISSFF